jgi:hypothetical protein
LRRLERRHWWLGWLKSPLWYADRLLRCLRALPREVGGPFHSLRDDPVEYVCSNLWMAAVAFGESRVDAEGQVFFGPESTPGPRLHLPSLVALRAELLLRGKRNELRMGGISAWIVLERCDAQGIHIASEA